MENEFSAVIELVRADFNVINNFFAQYSAEEFNKHKLGTYVYCPPDKANNRKLAM